MTWATSVPILVLLGLSVLDLGRMYTTDRDVRRKHRLMPRLLGAGYKNGKSSVVVIYTSRVGLYQSNFIGLEFSRVCFSEYLMEPGVDS